MKCPKCGANIPQDKLYCEKCGTELQIVPDIDIDFEIESTMKKTMSDIASNEFYDDDLEFDDDPNLISMIFGKHKTGKLFYVFLSIVVVLIIVGAVILGKRVSASNSYEYNLELADAKIADNDVLGAIACLEKANKVRSSAEVLFKIADYYYTLGRDNDAIYTLQEIIEGNFSNSDVANAYRKIVSLYSSTQNYEAIATVLDGCTNATIISEFGDYMVFTPEFNLEEGTYQETKMLKLSADGPGKIYYTLEGQTPNSSSNEFKTPIFLEYGSYTVSAVYINAHGVESEVVKAKYLIDVDFEFEPNILTESGTYTEATLIEADVPLMYTLYYTTDGTDPDKTSNKYTSPIPLKEGESTYKFVSYASDGTQSTIVEKHYTLHLEATFTPAEGVTALVETLISKNMLLPDGAHKEGVDGKFLYMYSAIYPIEGMGNYYFVVEYLEDSLGNKINTNNVYAVNCNNLSVYKVSSAGAGQYSLNGF